MGLKAMKPTAAVPVRSFASSRQSADPGIRERPQSTMGGVRSSWPPTSPNHQVSHMLANFEGSARPPRTRLPTPSVALTMVPGKRVSPANVTTREGTSSVSLPPENFPSSQAVMVASRLFPAAMVADVAKLPNVVTLARNAPTFGFHRMVP